MQVEVRGDSVIIDGYVNAVGRDSRPIRCQTGDFVEQVEPGVFGKALKRAKNIKLLLNHRADRELGSTSQGNLTLTEDNIGLRAHAEVGDPEIIRKARNNQLSGWSFGMYVNESEMEQRSNTIPRRKLKDIDMFEVSIIDTSMMPCYAGTSVECRAEGENALLETRAFEDTVETKNESLPENYFEEFEARVEQLRAECELVDMEKRIEELRYNPYHDPTNGRFTTASGSGGGYLFVGKGEKGKGQYVFDRDIDSEYDEWKKSKKASKRELDLKQIDRANAQGSNFYEAGTAIKNTYDREYEEIENLNISEEEKADARNKIYDYSAAELQARQNYFDVYTAGPARKVTNSDKALDKSIKIRGEHEAYISSLRDKSSRNTYKAQKEKEAELFRKAGAEAEKTGAREMIVNGETWFRTTKASHTWSKGTLKDYKAQQAYNKTQKNLRIGDSKRKPWSSLTEEEKKPFYKESRAITLDDYEKRAAELRYNPYHDPTNGRFTTASGSGGGYLFVGKGEKGKGQYVFDRDIDSEYDEWKKSKGNGVSAEDKAIREATNGVVQSAAKTTVEATVRKRNKSARPEFDKTVLAAKVDSEGNVIVDYAKGNYSGNYGDEYQTVTYNIQSGFVDGEPVNLDLSKAKTISGKTYDARQAAKAAGMTWNSTYGMYISKDVDPTKLKKMSEAQVLKRMIFGSFST